MFGMSTITRSATQVAKQSAMIALISSIGVSATMVQGASGACYRVATWSLEAFELASRRGFPERPDKVPPRTMADIRRIAVAIKGPIGAKIVALQQINAVDRGNRQVGSVELDALIRELGPNYRYFVGATGGSRRLAFIWDTRSVAANTFHEIAMPENQVADHLTPDARPSFRDTFERDPLAGRFTLLKAGVPKNDFVFVNIDLAFGQWRVENHDAAMSSLAEALKGLEGNHSVYPRGEADLLIGGNFNASVYDGNKESFFESYRDNNWKLLARGVYPPTRVSGSQVDYFLATRHAFTATGLVGAEIADDEAVVHQGLAASGRRDYRQVYSDHFPVTTCIEIGQDDD